jgi:hypothetical protein
MKSEAEGYAAKPAFASSSAPSRLVCSVIEEMEVPTGDLAAERYVHDLSNKR